MWKSAFFKMGRVVWTHSINNIVADNTKFAKEICSIMRRYCNKDWGEMSEADKKANDRAIVYGDRILASYKTSCGKVYVSTEHDGSCTTIMFASEY